MKTAKQNQKFPFHFFFRFAAEGWGEEAREKCKEIFWFLHTRVRERVRGALVRITAQSERTMQFQATTRSARAKLGILLEMGSDFFKQTPPKYAPTDGVGLYFGESPARTLHKGPGEKCLWHFARQ